jgi:hypothetical protein
MTGSTEITAPNFRIADNAKVTQRQRQAYSTERIAALG